MVFALAPVANQFSIELAPEGFDAMAHHGLWNVVQFMPKDVVDYFITNCPKNTWNEVHRAHHTVVCLSGVGYLDLLELHADAIKASACHGELLQWMQNEEFPNKETTLKILKA
jgi:hypothetical protein